MDVKLKAYKKDFEYSYTLGVFPTLELLNFQMDKVIKIILSEDGMENEGVKKIIDICEENNIECQMNNKAINRISKKKNCYAIGVFKKYEIDLSKSLNHVVLVEPSDMGNLGTIIRTILGFNIKNLAIIRPAVDIYDPKVVRASMGAIFKISFEYFDSFEEYMNEFDHNIYTFMLDAKETLPNIKVNKNRPFSLVFGNEGSGLSDEFLEIGTSIIIPHGDEIDSLNLSIAVGIACYEFTK